MKITFVQSADEKAESDRVIKAGLSLKKAKAGTWVLPPSMSVNNKFVVVDSQPDGKDVFVESFDTIDGALLYALGIRSNDNPIKDWDRPDALRDYGGFCAK